MFFEKFVKPSGPPSNILNVRSLKLQGLSLPLMSVSREVWAGWWGMSAIKYNPFKLGSQIDVYQLVEDMLVVDMPLSVIN